MFVRRGDPVVSLHSNVVPTLCCSKSPAVTMERDTGTNRRSVPLVLVDDYTLIVLDKFAFVFPVLLFQCCVGSTIFLNDRHYIFFPDFF